MSGARCFDRLSMSGLPAKPARHVQPKQDEERIA